jgi:outer membrane lipoprotein SlyB
MFKITMEKTMLKSLLRITVFLALPALGLAQAAGPPRGFSGTVVSVAGDTVTLKDKDGKALVVQMTPGWTVSVVRKVDAAAIKAGNFVATQNVPVDANTGKSTEVRILEPGYRPEEGTHAVSPTNANMMTHGTVKSARKTADGVELEVSYPDGSRRLLVAPEVPVTISDPQDRSVLKPGVAVGGVTRKGPDGVERASRLQPSNQ